MSLVLKDQKSLTSAKNPSLCRFLRHWRNSYKQYKNCAVFNLDVHLVYYKWTQLVCWCERHALRPEVDNAHSLAHLHCTCMEACKLYIIIMTKIDENLKYTGMLNKYAALCLLALKGKHPFYYWLGRAVNVLRPKDTTNPYFLNNIEFWNVCCFCW